MKTKWIAIALLPTVAAAWSWAQDKSGSNELESTKGGLTRVTPAGQGDADESFDREAWKKKLTAADLEERERAFESLADTARKSRNAREALEEWSKGGDTELGWTSRLLLREVERKPRAFGFGVPPGSLKLKRGHDATGWGGWGFDVDDFARRFDDLDSMFGDLRSQWEGMLESLPAPSGSSSSSESMSLQAGPDGVTCTITEKVDGKEETRKYEAESIEELLEAHPELKGKLGGGTTFQFGGFGPQQLHGGNPHVLRFAPRMSLRGDAPGDPLTTGTHGEPRTDMLGINCTAVDEGLRVEGVQPGTIASLIGLREGDVVVEINGAPIRERGDVKQALANRASDADVAVVVAGQNGERRTLTWKPKT